MGPAQLARLYAWRSLWSATGSRSAGRRLVDALGSPDPGVRTAAGMLLVRTGKRAEPLIEEAVRGRQHLPMTLLIAGDIGAAGLKPEISQLTQDPDPEIARAARDALQLLDRQSPPGQVARA